MTLRKLRSSDAAAVTVVNNLGAALLIFPFLAAGGTLTLSLLSLTLLVLMGAFQLGLPYYFFSLGLTRVPAHKAAIITLAEPLLVPVWTYVALGELVPRATLIGGGIILFALAIFIRFGQGRKLAKGASIGDFRSP
jgi:drug/metabolite transporter (DMT)-like permease